MGAVPHAVSGFALAVPVKQNRDIRRIRLREQSYPFLNGGQIWNKLQNTA